MEDYEYENGTLLEDDDYLWDGLNDDETSYEYGPS